MTRPTGLILTLVLSAGPSAHAGLYSPAEPTPFAVRPDGTAEPLGTDVGGVFLQKYTALLNVADPNPRRDNPERKAYLDRIAAARANPSRAGAAALAADLVRVGKPDEALNLLAERARDRVPDFAVLANLVHAHATLGQWNEAVLAGDQLSDLVADAGLPPTLPGTTPEQRAWLRKVEREYYPEWLRINRRRAFEKAPASDEDVLPLFDVRFVNDAGAYEPGKLAAAERAKLPPDAVAVVQQLLLWAPGDASLYWLLGELYAAEGKLREAKFVFNAVVDGRQYSNRRNFMAHRAAVLDAVEKLPPETPADLVLPADAPAGPRPPADDFLPSREKAIAAGAAFAVLALVLLALQFRSIGRRLRG